MLDYMNLDGLSHFEIMFILFTLVVVLFTIIYFKDEKTNYKIHFINTKEIDHEENYYRNNYTCWYYFLLFR